MMDNSIDYLNSTLKNIYNSLKNKVDENKDIGILTGTSGIALFYFKYSEYINSSESFDKGIELIEKNIDLINQGYTMPTYCTGLAGYGWLMNFLKELQYIDVDNGDLFDKTDELLYEKMIADIKDNNYDFLHGSIGYAFHFLQQFENSISTDKKNKYKEYILEFLYHLKHYSVKSSNGIKWKSYTNQQKEDFEYNISLSHGISSIINFLSRLYPYSCFKNETKDMLQNAVSFVVSYKGKDKKSISLFPNKINSKGDVSWNSRLAWCYGDLGVALSLWNYSKVMNNVSLQKEVIDIVKFSAKRRSRESTLVFDSTICHGAFGNAQIFNHFYNETKVSEFLETANFWINDGMSKVVDSKDYAGFRKWESPNKWIGDSSLLEGISGIGLSILSHITRDNSWDKSLMISL